MTRDNQLATRVDDETKRQFRVAAATRDMDMSELLRDIIEDFLEEERGAQAEGNPTAMAQTAD